jgi:hypothetical protein
MARQGRDVPRRKCSVRVDVGPAPGEGHGSIVGRRDPLDPRIPEGPDRRNLRIEPDVECEDEIVARQGLTVVPGRPRPDRPGRLHPAVGERPPLAVLETGGGQGELRTDDTVAVQLDQACVDKLLEVVDARQRDLGCRDAGHEVGGLTEEQRVDVLGALWLRLRRRSRWSGSVTRPRRSAAHRRDGDRQPDGQECRRRGPIPNRRRHRAPRRHFVPPLSQYIRCALKAVHPSPGACGSTPTNPARAAKTREE